MAENWLRTRRLEVGIKSQEELASKLQLAGFDISRASVGHWEQGRHFPPFENPDFCKALAKILDLSVPSLFALSGYEFSTSHTSAGDRIAYIVDTLPPHKQDLALKMIELLARQENGASQG